MMADVPTLRMRRAVAADMYCERAKLGSGQRVLELGCGWGSFSLFAAKRFPGSSFTAVSNSATQKEFIDAEAKKRGITNLTVRCVWVQLARPRPRPRPACGRLGATCCRPAAVALRCACGGEGGLGRSLAHPGRFAAAQGR